MGFLLLALVLTAMIPTGVAYSMVFVMLRQQARETKLICRSLNHLLNIVAEEEI